MPKNNFIASLSGNGGSPGTIGSAFNIGNAGTYLNDLQKSQVNYNLPKPKMVASLNQSTTGATAPSATPSPAKQQFVGNVASTAGLPTASMTPPPGTANGYLSPATQNPQPQAPAAPVAPPANNAYKSAFDEYIASLKPSDEENQATKYLNDLVLGKQKQDFEIQHRPGQTASFAGAEQERADAESSMNINSATNALNAFTAQRGAGADIAKARADYEKSIMPDNSPFALSPGQTRYDAQGNVIASSAPSAPSISDQFGTGSIGEYNFAKSQGYKGSFTDYQNEDANRKAKAAGAGITGFNGTLSPLAQAVQNGTITIDKIPAAQRAQVAAELATSGIAGPRQMALSTDLDVVNQLLNSDTNAITGVAQNPFNFVGLSNQKTLNLYNQLQGILKLENRQQLKGQGAISDFEFKVLGDAASSLGRNLSNGEFRSTLQKVKDVLEGKYANAGGLPTPGSNAPQSGDADYQAYLKAIGQ